MAFVWDEDKAALNVRRRGISFETATLVFNSVPQLEWPDVREDYGEERWNVVGLVDSVELVVTYTMRGDDVRIISARRTTNYEREEFWRSAI